MTDKIIALVSKYSGTSAEQINESTNLLHDLRMESMNFIDMVCEFEEAFACKIPERDFRKFITIKKIVIYMGEKQTSTLTKSEKESPQAGDLLGEDTGLELIKSRCLISPITRKLTEKVPALVEAVYGTGYASRYLYEPDKFWCKIEKGEVYPYIALNAEGKAAGMISLIKLSPNSSAFELGQLMVAPQYRGTDVAKLLISCISNQELKIGVIYSESVTSHKYSQRSCIAGGFADTALKLNIAHSHGEGHGEATQNTAERISCVCSCIERGETKLWCYLPAQYEEQVQFAFSDLPPLTKRQFRKASDIAPNNPTVFIFADGELETSGYVLATFMEVGADAPQAVAQLESKYEQSGKLRSLCVNVPLACPHNAAAVAALKGRGFIYGGVMPRWYPDSDGLLMQKLYDNDINWETTKLFSEKIIKIAESIKNDRV
ncbi:MAG: phosphopantetheine-binding protein [Oscillospiraceae bacterium]|nr:phosphopantetheine-binding protein [Oscillospiraceae bacterium]